MVHWYWLSLQYIIVFSVSLKYLYLHMCKYRTTLKLFSTWDQMYRQRPGYVHSVNQPKSLWLCLTGWSNILRITPLQTSLCPCCWKWFRLIRTAPEGQQWTCLCSTLSWDQNECDWPPLTLDLRVFEYSWVAHNFSSAGSTFTLCSLVDKTVSTVIISSLVLPHSYSDLTPAACCF